MTAIELIAEATKDTKWKNRVYLVGGSVRDELLGIENSGDYDLVVEGDALSVAKLLKQKKLTSISPVIYPRFGTAMVLVEGSRIELASARSESYESESRKPKTKPATLKEDMLRRDFTINALAKNIHSGELLDLLGVGLRDLRKRILRTPLEPSATFRDDPLRMLRAIRFKNRFDFVPAPGLLEAINAESHRLKIISFERIRDEFIKMLFHFSATKSLEDLLNTGLLKNFIPELIEGVGVEQGEYHSKDVWGHTLDVINQIVYMLSGSDEEDLVVLFSCLFHDIAKPRTKSVEAGGRIRFIGHEKVGEEMAVLICKRLRLNRFQGLAIGKLVRNHMRLGSAIPFTLSAARRLVREMGSLTEPLLRLCEADANAVGKISKGIDFSDVRGKIEAIGHQSSVLRLESPLSGNEIMKALKIPSGKLVGELKTKLTEAVLDGKIKSGDKNSALKLLKKIQGT